MLLALPAFADDAAVSDVAVCLAWASEGPVCERVSEALQAVVLPVDLAQMQLVSVVVDDSTTLRFDARPAIGGVMPRSDDAVAFACGTPALSALVAVGGKVEVTMAGRAFAEISTCVVP